MQEAEPKGLHESFLTEKRLLEQISGENLEKRLLELAEIGGLVKEVGKYVEVTRLAFTKEDLAARSYLDRLMKESGMDVEHHPFGLIGVCYGQSPELPAVMLLSHFDSVPKGGMYDGALGTIGAIEVVRLLCENKIKFARTIVVLAATAEESSRFNNGLAGSRALFHGLTDKELAAKRPGDCSLGEALCAWGFNLNDVKTPRFTKDQIHAAIELHISQNAYLEESGKGLGVVKAIAAPDRREIIIGEPINKTNVGKDGVYFEVKVKGQAGHSGATPMGLQYRADGLLPLADFLIKTTLLAGELDVQVAVDKLLVESQALNKIPGHASCLVVLSGSATRIEKAKAILKNYGQLRNKQYARPPTKFSQQAISIEEVKANPPDYFFDPASILARCKLAGQIIRIVNSVSGKYRDYQKETIVGTVTTLTQSQEGQIILGVDVRGTDELVRNHVWHEVLAKIETVNKTNVDYTINKLSGSNDPTTMDQELVRKAEAVIQNHNLGQYEITFSPAGHDSQNAARAGIPTVMFFIPSRNSGASHVPQEYSTAQDLERGAKALAALVVRLTL